MAEFVTIKEDKFENKTTYVTTNGLILDEVRPSTMWITGPEIRFRRIVVMPDYDTLLMDIDESDTVDWPQLMKGQIILLIDGEKITLNPHENYHNRTTCTDGYLYKESCYYDIDKDLLKRICDSKSFAMKLYGGGSFEVKNVNAVVVFSKLFYNAVYDNTAYTDVVKNAIEHFTNGSICNDISLDGSGAKGGCMAILAFFITMTGAAIGGLCSLI